MFSDFLTDIDKEEKFFNKATSLSDALKRSVDAEDSGSPKTIAFWSHNRRSDDSREI